MLPIDTNHTSHIQQTKRMNVHHSIDACDAESCRNDRSPGDTILDLDRTSKQTPKIYTTEPQRPTEEINSHINSSITVSVPPTLILNTRKDTHTLPTRWTPLEETLEQPSIKATTSERLLTDRNVVTVNRSVNDNATSDECINTTDDVYTSLEPLIKTSRVFGLVCFKDVQNSPGKKCRFSPFAVVFNIFLIITLVLLAVVGTFVENIENRDTDLPKRVTNGISQFLSSLLAVSYLLSAYKQQTSTNCIAKLANIDEALTQLGISVAHRHNGCLLTKFICVGFGITFLNYYICYFFELFHFHPQNLTDITIGFFFLFRDLLILVGQYQFVAWLSAISQRLSLVQTRLHEAGHEDLNLVHTAASLHASLVNLSESVNSMFDIQLLLGMAMYFFDGFLYLYWIKFYISGDTVNVYYVVCYVLGLTWLLTRLITICKMCEKPVAEEYNIGDAVHQALRNSNESLIQEKLRNFSAQLTHKRIQFTACSFFPVNLNLVYCMSGAAVTYLLIMHQLDKEFGGSVPTIENNSSEFDFSNTTFAAIANFTNITNTN